MQIVIDIDEDLYTYMQSRYKYQNKGDEGLSTAEEAGIAIKNGTPLPEGHGDLIDKNKLSKKKQYLFKTDNGAFPKSEWFIKADDLFSAEAIIPADEETKKKARNK